MKAWMMVLGLAAGLGLAGEDAFADRRGGGSSAQRSHSHSSSQRHHHNHSFRPHQGHRQHHSHSRRHHHHHGHSHLRFWAAPVIVAPPAYYYYSAPPPVEYIEKPRSAGPPASVTNGYWYYCPDNRLYYPYTQECPSAWMQVAPGTPP
jgi:hypothetical protein